MQGWIGQGDVMIISSTPQEKAMEQLRSPKRRQVRCPRHQVEEVWMRTYEETELSVH
jgi:hypothetical protein